MSRAGYVYILSNPSIHGLVKIGRSNDVSRRVAELNSTGVPMPFKVEYKIYSMNCHNLESRMHRELAQYRVASGKEFFEVSVAKARDKLDYFDDGNTARRAKAQRAKEAREQRARDKVALEKEKIRREHQRVVQAETDRVNGIKATRAFRELDWEHGNTRDKSEEFWHHLSGLPIVVAVFASVMTNGISLIFAVWWYLLLNNANKNRAKRHEAVGKKIHVLLYPHPKPVVPKPVIAKAPMPFKRGKPKPVNFRTEILLVVVIVLLAIGFKVSENARLNRNSAYVAPPPVKQQVQPPNFVMRMPELARYEELERRLEEMQADMKQEEQEVTR